MSDAFGFLSRIDTIFCVPQHNILGGGRAACQYSPAAPGSAVWYFGRIPAAFRKIRSFWGKGASAVVTTDLHRTSCAEASAKEHTDFFKRSMGSAALAKNQILSLQNLCIPRASAVNPNSHRECNFLCAFLK